MKKKYLTIAGILSAIILIAIFIMVFFITSPVLLLVPVITVDPMTDENVDENNFLMISGKTNLPEMTHIVPSVYPASGQGSLDSGKKRRVARGDIWIQREAGVSRSWNGTIDIASLQPGRYEIAFTTIDYDENFTRVMESETMVSVPFILGEATCTGSCIRKRTPPNVPFIRVNPYPMDRDPGMVTGITSFSPDSFLSWTIEGNSGTNLSGPSPFTGTTTVYQGAEGISRWSVILPEGMSPGEYRFTVTPDTGEGKADRPDVVSGSLEFQYPGWRNPSDLRDEKEVRPVINPYITIDALPDMMVRGRYLITGTTNLPVNETIMVEIVHPNQMNTFNFTIDPRDSSQGGVFSGIAGCTAVLAGYRDENLWTFELQTYSLEPGRYEMTISNPEFQPGTPNLEAATASVSRIFTLHGGP